MNRQIYNATTENISVRDINHHMIKHLYLSSEAIRLNALTDVEGLDRACARDNGVYIYIYIHVYICVCIYIYIYIY